MKKDEKRRKKKKKNYLSERSGPGHSVPGSPWDRDTAAKWTEGTQESKV